MKFQPDNPRTSPPPSLRAQLTTLPRPVWILSAGLFINRFGTFVVPFLTLYLTGKGYSEEKVWMVFAAMAVGGLGASLSGGWLADRIGRRNTMALSLFSGSLSMLLLWQADTMPAYLITAALAGFTHGMYHPASHSLLVDVTTPENRVTAYAVVRWAINLGFAFGMALGGVLAKINYSWLFIGDAATSAIFGLIALLTLPHGVRAGSREESRWAPALESMLSNRPFLALFAANLMGVSLFFQWGGAVSRLVIDLGFTEKDYGRIMALNGVMIALCEIPISQWAGRHPRRLIIALGYLFCGLGVFLNGFAGGWGFILFAMAVFTVGEMISMPVSGAYLAELSPEKMRGRYSGAIGITWSLGNMFAIGAGLVLYRENPMLLWSASLGLGMVAALVLWRVK